MKKPFLILFIAINLLISSAKAQSVKLNDGTKYPGYTMTKSGLYYKMLTTNTNAKKPKMGDVLTMGMIDKTENDSIIYNSYADNTTQGQSLIFPLGFPSYKGDLTEGFYLMGIGDSADFITSADSFFLKVAHIKELPSFIKKGSDLKFSVKLINIQTRTEYDKQQQEISKQKNEKIEKLKEEEPVKIRKYLDSNKIKVKPTISGLYYIETQKGSGPKIEKGDTVYILYTGKFIDGTIFESSTGLSSVKFPYGEGSMLKGWVEGIGMMKKGTKATLLIPSSLAFGEKGGGQLILPYTPLIYEVEILDVIKGPLKK
jgi:FKBP-type peptidyl-prolyl cis-trans isomerase FkpA